MTKNLTIVITMAGIGSRFRKAGYSMPKYQIVAHGRTLFEWSMVSLDGFREVVSKYIFIVREEDNAHDLIRSQCKKLSITDFQLIELDHMTDGQATTAMLAAPYWSKEDALLIYNIDTYVESGKMNASQLCGDGFIHCFKADGDHWSFVKTDESGKATEVREKKRISEHCSLGAYYFKSSGLYEKLYRECYSSNKNLEKNEKYIAPLYNYLIERDGEVYISDIDPETVHVLGTPEELNIFLNSPVKACNS